MSSKEGNPVASQKVSKPQRNLRNRQGDSKMQDGGSGDCGYSSQLALKVTESVGKMMEEKLAKFMNALVIITAHVDNNIK